MDTNFFGNLDFPIYDIQGNLHPCFHLGRSLANCLGESLMPQTECYKVSNDYLECYNGRLRHHNMAVDKLIDKNANVVSVPVYNVEKDEFEKPSFSK